MAEISQAPIAGLTYKKVNRDVIATLSTPGKLYWLTVISLFGLFNLVLPLGPSLAAMSGLLVGYLGYDLGHMAWHHAACRRGVLRYLKRYHLAHHFRDQDSRFGVSQPLWDWVFRSGSLRL